MYTFNFRTPRLNSFTFVAKTVTVSQSLLSKKKTTNVFKQAIFTFKSCLSYNWYTGLWRRSDHIWTKSSLAIKQLQKQKTNHSDVTKLIARTFKFRRNWILTSVHPILEICEKYLFLKKAKFVSFSKVNIWPPLIEFVLLTTIVLHLTSKSHI